MGKLEKGPPAKGAPGTGAWVVVFLVARPRATCTVCRGEAWAPDGKTCCVSCGGTGNAWPLGLSFTNGHRGWGTSDVRGAELYRTRETAERRAAKRRADGFPAWPVQLPWTAEQLDSWAL